jgi:2-oxo-4-hydroxy-4-carboxy-5-ureidoimidazoline decarboxylase
LPHYEEALMDLATFNAAPEREVTEQLLACCDVGTWARSVVTARPYATVDDLFATAGRASRQLGPDDIDRALAAHPRIGDRAAGGTRRAAWSRQEQSGVGTDEQTRVALVEGNREYEERFGRVFLICATGLGAGEILQSLRRRLGNDDRTEAAEVLDELGKIAQVRLRKVVEP